MKSYRIIRSLVVSAFAVLLSTAVLGQDLSPRAYVITPVHSNAVIVSYTFVDGNLAFNGSVPITDATATAAVPILSFYHSFSLLGRSANFTASLPYGYGDFKGVVLGTETNVHRSGMFDSVYRLAVNLKGGKAMDVREFLKYNQKTVIGASIKMVAPTGQYDPARLISFGANRWGFKPEMGISRRWGHWILDAYGGVWFYTKNPEFFSHNEYVQGTQVQTQSPVASFEGHLSYDLKRRCWISLDGNYWSGGRTSINGVVNSESLQSNSRIGVTGSFPINRHQSVKVSYSKGTYIRYGGNYHNLSVAWQFSWLGRPN